MAPEYLCELVSIRKSIRKLKTSSQILQQVPVSRLKSYGDCAFIVAAPTLWNKLPANIRKVSSFGNFKSLLKTHLFKVAFTDNNYDLLNHYRVFTDIICGIIILHIICTAPLNGSC